MLQTTNQSSNCPVLRKRLYDAKNYDRQLIQQLTAYHPDFVIVNIGGNDIRCETAPKMIANDILKPITEIQKFDITVVFSSPEHEVLKKTGEVDILTMKELVKDLISNISSDKELITLQQLSAKLLSTNRENHVEQDSLCLNTNGEESTFLKVTAESICTTQEDLNRFTCYLFDRRYGWSETDKEDGRRVRRLSSTGYTMSAGNEKQKTILNALLDQFIAWYFSQELCLPALNALYYTIKQCANMPVVRHQTVIHTMEWMKENQEQLCDQSLFSAVLDLILLSATDIWSAVRNACSNRLAPVASSFSLEHHQQLSNSLIQICVEESSWQAKEGAIMGINAVLQRFLNKSSGKSPMSSPRILDSDNQEKQLPDFITAKIHSVVFGLLSHPQLTIREHAAKTLATYITCSNVMDALSTLHEVLLILRNGKDISKNNHTKNSSIQFLDDYAAEGFLGVCIFLVKVIPLKYLLPGWPDYISTFLLYLSHPASTVRQAASSVFKYLVVKSCHSVVVLKLMLQSLAMHWNPDTDSMTLEMTQDSIAVGNPLPSVTEYKGGNLTDTWEGREGRLFAYELIFKYLIKNHWLYTFGPAGTGQFMDTGVSKEEDPVSVPEKLGDQKASGGRVIHHVESEKSLAVRFLTQAEINEDYMENPVKARLEKIVSVDQEVTSTPIMPGSKGQRSEESFNTRSDVDGICSLLTEAQILDTCTGDISETEKAKIKQELQLSRLKQLVENDNKSQDDSCTCGWMEKEYLQDMSRILKVILYQTAESVGHSQWELRRIAKQVLPCLAEVIRWYDINLLVSIWNSYLNIAVPTCLMTYTSVMLLKESVVHTVRLTQLLHKPPHTWKDHDRCKDYLLNITNTVQRRISTYLPHLQHLVQRQCYDRLSIVAADIMLMTYEHFVVVTDQKLSHCLSVLELWKKIFFFAHPKTRISVEILQRNQKEIFIAPFEGYLSCCLVKPDNKMQCAKQVEKQFISEIYHRLPAFIDSLPAQEIVPVIPVLAHYVGQFVGETHISKVILEVLHSSIEPLMSYMRDLIDVDQRQFCLKCILITLKELAAVIAIQSVDLPQVQKVLGLYEVLCRPVRLGSHLGVMFSGISARLNEKVKFSLDTGPNPGCDGDDLYLMSNDIPRSYSPEVQGDSDSEEAVGTPSNGRFLESLTLNTSNNSGSFSGRLSALSCHSNDGGQSSPREPGSDNEDDSSDWDSWDEEEEGQSALGDVFMEFLAKLQKSNNTDFMAEVKKLGEHEKAVITGLLKS